MRDRKLWFVFFLLFLFLFFSQKTFAVSIPIPLEPENNSTITDTSPKLSWQYSDSCYTGGSCFRVQISSSEEFSSIDKDYYTNNTYYTPQNLTLQKWFWKVKAKDSSATWSDWSSIWSFTIVEATPTPTPTSTPPPAPTSTPTPTTAPTATKTPTPTPIKTPTPTPKSSSGGSGATATPKPTSPPTSAPTKILALSSQAAGGSGNINTAISPTATSSPTSTKGPTKKPTPTPIKSGQTAILGVAQTNLSKILIGAGLLFLLACGILAFRNFKREKIS